MNYNTLRNKPTINYRELIGDSTVSEVGGITEEEFDNLLDTDLASYYTKAQIDELFARSYVFREKSGDIVTFDCPESTNGIAQVVSDIVAVQSGSGDPSQTNIRPFTGWSAVNVHKNGVNFFDASSVTIADITFEDSGGSTLTKSGFRYNLPAGNYSAKCFSETVQTYVYIRMHDKDGHFIDRVALSTTAASGWRNPSFTLNEGDYIIVYAAGAGATLSANNMLCIENDVSSVTEYVAYSGSTYTTTLKDGNSNPLTCYGGGLMNAGGSQALLVTKGHIASYNGETLPSTWLSDRDVYAAGTTPSIGAEVVYELETPLQIPQDSLSIVSTGGINNIWCDSGDITVKALDRIIQG